MEPVTHVLTGACLARAGLNRRTAYATAAMAIAAEFPDIDVVWSFRGPVSGFEHHRGITHTFLGVPFEAGIILLGFFAYDQLRGRKRITPRKDEGDTSRSRIDASAPVRWSSLFVLLVIALLSHLALDYTNNYGLRPFFPFIDRWYAGSFVFIFDPLLFLALLTGLLMPALFGLIGREVGARRERYRGRGWARAALIFMLLLWTLRWVEHGKAVALAQSQTLRAPGAMRAPMPDGSHQGTPAMGSLQPGYETEPAPESDRPLLQPGRSLASPDPLSVFRWYTATDYGVAYRLGLADTRIGTFTAGQTFERPLPSPVLEAAEGSHVGRVYLDWSPMPVLSVADGVPEEFAGEVSGRGEAYRTVTFTDPRFMGELPWLHRTGPPPLAGQVVLSTAGEVIAEGMDGRFGR